MRPLGVVVAVGVLSASCLLLAACDKDDDFIPMGHEAGKGGEAANDGGSSVIGRGGSQGSGGTQSGEGGVMGLAGNVGAAGEGGAPSGGAESGAAGEGGAQSGGGGASGQAGQAAGGEAPGGGAGGSDQAGGVCDGDSAPAPEDLPACTPAVNDPDGGNECRECMKQHCCEPWQACYGEAPRGACGYGSMGDEIGQMDCLIFCYYQDADGVKSLEDVLAGCQQKCVGSCASLSQATTEIVSCAIKGPDGDDDGNDDCLDVCFPPVE
jgi:hypothetical protein